MKKRNVVLSAMALSLSVAMAGGQLATVFAEEAAAEAAAAEESGFPFTLVTKDDQEVVFDHVPETILSTNVNVGDQLMAMGLGDKIVGTCSNNTRVAPEYREEYEAIPEFSEKQPGLEAILDLDPDFVYGRSSAFNEDKNTTHDTLSSYGIMSLSSIEGYKLGADLEDVYQDFYNLGRIFEKQDRAEEIVSEMKAKVADVEERVKDAEPIRVLVYDYGEDTGVYTCGDNFTANLIRHAGGVNIFEDMEKTWQVVSFEEILERDPEYIVINDYGSTSLEQKIEDIKTNEALSNLKAVQEEKFIAVTLCESFASSMTADTIEKFAQAFHPDCF